MKAWLLLSLISFVKSEDITVSEETTAKEIPENMQEKIVTGYECELDEYSHIAVLTGGHKLLCGASVISENWILTAAHCCEKIKKWSYYSINVGQKEFGKQSVHQQRTNIRQMHIHRDYNTNPLDSDICVIKTTDKIKIKREVRISELVSTEDFLAMQKGNKCERVVVMGFGGQEMVPWGDKRVYNPHVQCASLEIVERKDCHDFFGSIISDSIFCAGDLTGLGRDACKGDSGGPIFCEGVQIGIVSAGFGCGVPRYPGLYCRVDIFRDFIEQAQTGALGNTQNTFAFLFIYIHVIHIIIILFTTFGYSMFC